ncbi:hypothetical protein C4564_03345 [Candidatus Microgenomates bacterium]|nr:MAG: hypothetical protein C4564_03345 [Candidatus Microgenomates bacterium]
MEKQLKSTFESFKSVLVLLPKSPYFDQVAAGLSLYLSLKETKQVAISCPTPMMVEFNRLVGVDRVVTEVGNKNLEVSFSEYPADNIERVSWDVDASKQVFKLKVIPKPGAVPPAKEQIELNYSGVSADAAILIGGANDSHFPALAMNELVDTKLIHIGVQDLSTGGKRPLISLSKPASSVSEIVGGLIKSLGLDLSPDVASNLLAGVQEGTKNFTHNQVSAGTFKLVAELMEKGGQRNYTKPEVESKNFPPGVVPTNMPAFKDIKQDSFDRDEKPEGETVSPPTSWLQPKIFKGTSVS